MGGNNEREGNFGSRRCYLSRLDSLLPLLSKLYCDAVNLEITDCPIIINQYYYIPLLNLVFFFIILCILLYFRIFFFELG